MNSKKPKMVWKSKSQKLQPSISVMDELDFVENVSSLNTKNKKIKMRPNFSKEDVKNKVKNLKEESSNLVSEDKYEEAIERLNEARELQPEDETIYEMLSQIYILTRKDFQAIKFGEKVVEMKRIWWIGWQTLGRAQMNYGDVDMAIKSFSRALHLKPDDNDLQTEDLEWAVSIKQSQLQTENG